MSTYSSSSPLSTSPFAHQQTPVPHVCWYQRWLCHLLSYGPLPRHIAIIMDGNRRFAHKHHFRHVIDGHTSGYKQLLHLLQWCSLLNHQDVAPLNFDSISEPEQRPTSVTQPLVAALSSFWNFFSPVPLSEGKRGISASSSTSASASSPPPPPVSIVSVYALSLDNLSSRSPEEVSQLLELFESKLTNFLEHSSQINQQSIRVRVLGHLSVLPLHLQMLCQKVMYLTQHNTRLHLNLCVGYSSQCELMDAAVALKPSLHINGMHTVGDDVQQDSLGCTSHVNEDINSHCLDGFLTSRSAFTTQDLLSNLYTTDLPYPHPDLLLRTSGETRLSDFLLYQATHSHLVFVDAFWPELSFMHFLLVILEYQKHALVRFWKNPS